VRITSLNADEVLASLKSTARGLSAAEAQRRLKEFGPNHLEEVAGVRLPLRLARELSNFFAVILWIAAALCFVAEAYHPGDGMARLGWAIVGVILINGVFSFWQEYRAERAIAALRDLLPQRVAVTRDGEVRQVAVEELVPGDVVLVEEGENVPSDCRLIEALGLRVNTATITGESRPKMRHAGPSEDDSPLTATNLLLAGTSVLSGTGRAVVFATGMRTEFGRIAHLTQTAGEAQSPLQREIARLSSLVAALATGLGVVFFAIGQALGMPFWENALFAIGIIVANVPEGLLPTVTLSLAMATQRMAKRNALVRHLPAVEALGSTTVICCDKTGTLTRNRMAVRALWLGGANCSPGELRRRPDLASACGWLTRNAALCHNLRDTGAQGERRFLGDPMEVALATLALEVGGPETGLQRVDEIPFDTDRKRMSVVCESPQERVLLCKGALETVVPRCTAVQWNGRTVPLDEPTRRAVLGAQDAMAETGLRVLAFAHAALREGEPAGESAMTLDGLVGLEDPPRPEVPPAIARCIAAGIRVIMVTGDHPHTARAIAREIGLTRGSPVVVTGESLRRMTPAQLQLALDSPEIIFARVAAEQKMLIVAALQKKGEIVAVTGDGVNDAPALKTADIGIAMGISGTDVAKQAADIILLDDNFASIVDAVEEGRSVFDNLRKFLTYILTSNIPELLPYLAFVLFRIPLPLTIMQILAVDLGTDIVPALALGAERPDPAVMQRPPRPRRERLLSWPLVARAYLFLGMLEAVVALAAFFFVLEGGGWVYGEVLARNDPLYLQATTACLSAIVVAQVVNVFLCRHPRRSAFSFGIAANPLILWGIGAELALLLAIVYTPAGNALFGTAPLPPAVWLFVLPFALGMLALEEVRKAVVRRSMPEAAARP
jgi:calcium-translocating P-type ATPase